MNKIIMSGEKPELVKNLSKFGYDIITTESINEFLPFEQYHADMQCLKINDALFVLKNSSLKIKLDNVGINYIETEENPKTKYPKNILLNCLYINNNLYCKENATDKTVIDYCNKNNIKIINVNQGYSKCSVAIIGKGFITSDKGIYSSLTNNGVEGVLITPGDIELDGVDYGFIGGCCFSDKNNTYFTGNITKHIDYKKIEDFCYSNNKNIICLSNKKLYDIGGFVAI